MSWFVVALSVVGGILVGFVALQTPPRPYRNRCEATDRCVYDPGCPFYRDCELTDYTQ